MIPLDVKDEFLRGMLAEHEKKNGGGGCRSKIERKLGSLIREFSI